MSIRLPRAALVLAAVTAVSLPLVALTAGPVSSSDAAANISVTADAGVVRLRSTTDVPSFLYLFDRSAHAVTGGGNDGSQLVVEGDYYGLVPTYVSTTNCEVKSSRRALCPPGRIELRYGPAGDHLLADWYDAFLNAYFWVQSPMTIRAGDGQDGITGGRADDQIFGEAGWDDLEGGEGDDLLDGGSAPAFAGDNLEGGAGNDTLRSRNGVGDSLDCGSGEDVALVDQWDRVRGCETVRIERMPHLRLITTGDSVMGTPGDDRLTGTNRASRLDGRRGDDVLRGRGGQDGLHGRAGKDKVVGGKGRDWMTGGKGNDRLLARDGRRDHLVNCGPGRDVAIVDRADQVRGCEIVRRR